MKAKVAIQCVTELVSMLIFCLISYMGMNTAELLIKAVTPYASMRRRLFSASNCAMVT